MNNLAANISLHTCNENSGECQDLHVFDHTNREHVKVVREVFDPFVEQIGSLIEDWTLFENAFGTTPRMSQALQEAHKVDRQLRKQRKGFLDVQQKKVSGTPFFLANHEFWIPSPFSEDQWWVFALILDS